MDSADLQKRHFDVWLLFITVALVACGVIMVYSASAVFALERYGDSTYFLKRTGLFALLGFVCLAGSSIIPYHFYRRFIYLILFTTIGIALLVFVPGLGRTMGGATRWLNLGPVAFQPSELAKVAMIFYLAYSLEKKIHRIRTLSIGILPHVVIMTLVAAIIIQQRDFGSAAIIAMMTWMLLFAAGARLMYLGGMITALIPVAVFLISSSSYRRNRILAFLNPWDDQYGTGFQMIQSFVAFNEGGWFGRGLGEGQQKLFYLPEAHTDFIFSVIGEELGLIGVLLVIGLFCAFCYRGLRIALNAPDLFGRFVALGITLLIGLQAMLNMGVVMGLLPTKGLTLPFLSYGGSSLTVSLFAVGILLNVSSYQCAVAMPWRGAERAYA